MIWSKENFQGRSYRCDGQCTMEKLSDTNVGNDNAESGKVTETIIIAENII